MTAPMISLNIVISTLAPKIRQIIKAFNLQSLSLNSVPVTMIQQTWVKETTGKFRVTGQKELTMDAHYTTSLPDGQEIKLLPSALGLSDPLPAMVCLVAEEKKAAGYKNVKGLQVDKWESAWLTETGYWGNGILLVNGPPPESKRPFTPWTGDTSILLKDGEQIEIDFTTHFLQLGNNTPRVRGKVEKTAYYSVNDGRLVECRYVDFLVSNIRSGQTITFHLLENGDVLSVRSNGEFVGAIALCKRDVGLQPEPHKPPKQTKSGILFAPEQPATEQEIDTMESKPEQPAIIEHTTRKGKVICGIIRHDLDKDQAQAIDPYTFKKDGGWFIREKHLDELATLPETAETDIRVRISESVETAPKTNSALDFPAAPPDPESYENGSTWYGGRYDSNLSTTDICKKVRQHLKDEATYNPLFVGSKFSVRKDHHKSIYIRVMEMNFNPKNPEHIQETMNGAYRSSSPWLTPDGQAFIGRIESLLNSYNFDGSDTQTDYFHVNFYKDVALDHDLSERFYNEIVNNLDQAVIEYRQKIKDSWPACSQCGEKSDSVYDTASGLTGLCWECYYPHYKAEQDARNEADRLEREETARQVAKLAEVELTEADEMVRVNLPNLNKCCWISEYSEQMEKGEYKEVQGKITHRAQLTTEQYDILADNLLSSLPWLAGKGGTDSTADLPGTEDLDFFQLTPEQQDAWRAGAFSLFVAVSAPGRETLYLDPQGGSYARYVGFAVIPSLDFSEEVENVIPALEFTEMEQPGEVEPLKFAVGQTYYTRSIGDHNCIFTITIAKRTEKTVTTTKGKLYRPKVRTNWKGNKVESISAGNWSMAHGWDADDDKKLLPDWEQPARQDNSQAKQVDEALLMLDAIIQDIEDVPEVTTTAKATTSTPPSCRWGNVAPSGAVKAGPVPVRSDLPPVVLFPVADLPTAEPVPVQSDMPVRFSSPKSDMPVRFSEPPAKPQPRVRISTPAASLPEKDEAFYPTPTPLVWAMTGKIKGHPRTILDPSAGKGDLLEKVRDGYSHQRSELYAIEIDNNLRAILQGKKFQVIDSDFLAWSGPDKFDCILMNPPFNRGAEHLLKAIEIMYSGQIICLLNAETLRNPCTNTRKELARQLKELGAEIEYKERQFLGAERKTAVDVALVSITIERRVEDDLFQGATDQAEGCAETIADKHEVSTGQRIEEMVARYREVVRLSTETILSYYRHYNVVGQYVSLNDENRTLWTPRNGQELTGQVQALVNSTARKIRTNYWRLTLDLPEVRERMTQKRKAEFAEKLKANESMDFTESNIRQFLLNLIDGYTKTLEDGVAEVFGLMTLRHCYDDGLMTENIHYFNGWKTNSAYRVGQRVILPIRGSYGSPFRGWNGWQLDYAGEAVINDLDLVMSYFNGGQEYKHLAEAIKEAFAAGEQSGRSEFFKFKCHQKGTIHLTFLDENILRRFNVAACKGKGWLPGDYGSKPFKDMSPQEKTVVKSFEPEGETGYTANLNRPMFDATFTPIALLEAA